MATQWLTRAEAAEYIGVAYSTLNNWASNGRQEIPYYKVGRHVKYKQHDLDEWLEKQRKTHA